KKLRIMVAALTPTEATLLLRKFDPHAAVALWIVGPPFAHLHEKEQVHLLLGKLGDLLARLRADRLDRCAALAEHDLALAFAFDIDRLLDPRRAVAQVLPDIC